MAVKVFAVLLALVATANCMSVPECTAAGPHKALFRFRQHNKVGVQDDGIKQIVVDQITMLQSNAKARIHAVLTMEGGQGYTANAQCRVEYEINTYVGGKGSNGFWVNTKATAHTEAKATAQADGKIDLYEGLVDVNAEIALGAVAAAGITLTVPKKQGDPTFKLDINIVIDTQARAHFHACLTGIDAAAHAGLSVKAVMDMQHPYCGFTGSANAGIEAGCMLKCTTNELIVGADATLGFGASFEIRIGYGAMLSDMKTAAVQAGAADALKTMAETAWNKWGQPQTHRFRDRAAFIHHGKRSMSPQRAIAAGAA